MINALSFDVEEWYHRNDIDIAARHIDGNRGKVVDEVSGILDLLESHHTRSTFFVVGSLAEEYPEMVRSISERGHEVASHGYDHRLVYAQRPEDFRNDLRKSIFILEKTAGKPVLGYRAPSWSITGKSLWALDILREEGIRYDSSIFPIETCLYGLSSAESVPGEIRDGLLEFPASVQTWCGRRFPFASGVFFRLMPFWLIMASARQTNAQKRVFMVNVHSWEMTSFTKRLSIACSQTLAYKSRLTFLGNAEEKLKRMMDVFSFAPLSDVIGVKNEARKGMPVP